MPDDRVALQPKKPDDWQTTIWDAWWGDVFYSLPERTRATLSIQAWRHTGLLVKEQMIGEAAEQALAKAVEAERERIAVMLAWKQNLDPRTEQPLDTARNKVIMEMVTSIRAQPERKKPPAKAEGEGG